MDARMFGRAVEGIRREKGVEAIYLFGSRANGMEKPYSDVDICVVTGKDADERAILANSSDTIDTSIFWKLPLNLRHRVLREGRPLYVKDELAMHRIKVNTVLSYLDFKPLLERHFLRFTG